jgi:hypothetical protein
MRKLDMLTKTFSYAWMSPHLQFQRSNCYLLLLMLKQTLVRITITRRGTDNNSIRHL